MTRARFAALCVAFFVTGGSALCLQVVWHRVLTLHSGVDLGSATTVVVAFLTGLALGNLAGGRVADHLGARRSLLGLAGAEAGVAALALVSVPLLQRTPTTFLPDTAGPVAALALYALALLLPTFLMGTTIPLAAAVIAESQAPAVGSRLGWL